IYPSGSNVIIYHIEQKTQKILNIGEHCIEITAISLSDNKRFLAVAELSPHNYSAISILDMATMRKRRVLTVPDFSKAFTNIVFSHDNKCLLASSGEPDWSLFYWSWEKGKLLGQQKLSMPASATIEHISFHPQDTTHICVTGNCMFKMFRHTEGGFKSTNLHKFDTKCYTSHMWVSNETVLLGTRDGRFYLSEGGELREDFIVNHEKPDEFPLTILQPFENGFMTGNTNGCISIFERVEDKMVYRKARDVMTNDQQIGINSVALSPGHDIISVSLENNQLFGFSLVNTEISKDQSSMPLFSYPFHQGSIVGLDTCIKKPLLVTCGADQSVRLWNYEENTCDLVKYFNEDIYSVALHPSGFYVLLGFSDKLKMMSIMSDELRVMKEFPVRACKEVRFCSGGQYFAAANGNTIHVYSTWTYENVNILKGHIGKVKALCWCMNDQVLISGGQDGAVYEWNVVSGKRQNENVLKSCSYYSLARDSNLNCTYAVGSDCVMRVIEGTQIVKEYEMAGIVTQLVLSDLGNVMVGGTSEGSIRMYKYPMEGKMEYQEHFVHSSGINKIRISFDNEYLFTVSEDGTLFVCKLSDREGRGKKKYLGEMIHSSQVMIIMIFE
ncbi:WD40 repeat-like protein, partial [Rozella allomycis CSF55]